MCMGKIKEFGETIVYFLQMKRCLRLLKMKIKAKKNVGQKLAAIGELYSFWLLYSYILDAQRQQNL